MSQEKKLHRQLGILDVTAITAGIVVGAGVFVITGIGAKYAGSLTWLSYAIGAVPVILAGLSTIYLVAPNTPDERIQYLGFEAQELLYAVALLGVTGASLTARQRLESYLQRVRMNTSVPFVVGFGISTTEDVRQIAALADGVVVGSALLARLKEASDPVAETHRYLGTLADALAEIDSSSMESESR